MLQFVELFLLLLLFQEAGT